MSQCKTCHCKACGTKGMILPGWLCDCGVFNGEGKSKLTECRVCGKGKPISVASKRAKKGWATRKANAAAYAAKQTGLFPEFSLAYNHPTPSFSEDAHDYPDIPE